MTQVMQGTICGTTIQLASDPGIADGQRVEVILRPVEIDSSKTGEGLRAAFGAWSDDLEGLDRYLEQVRQDRKQGRRNIE